jgi:antirestriction protein
MPINSTQKPIYESFSMLHPDGTFMCHINEKRAHWYVERGLADWVSDKIFKLKFEPKGKGKQDILFYTQKLENRCVVCGTSSDGLNKHHVVPYVFRSRFPKEYKQSNHHDILVTCVDCHEKYEHKAMQHKIDLVKEAGFTMHYPLTENQRINKKILSARKLIEKVDSGELKDEHGVPFIPEEKLNQLRSTASSELLPEGDIPEATEWADKLIEKVIAENKLYEFVKEWREHFINNTHPQYLPEHWSVDHPLEISNK